MVRAWPPESRTEQGPREAAKGAFAAVFDRPIPLIPKSG